MKEDVYRRHFIQQGLNSSHRSVLMGFIILIMSVTDVVALNKLHMHVSKCKTQNINVVHDFSMV